MAGSKTTTEQLFRRATSLGGGRLTWHKVSKTANRQNESSQCKRNAEVMPTTPCLLTEIPFDSFVALTYLWVTGAKSKSLFAFQSICVSYCQCRLAKENWVFSKKWSKKSLLNLPVWHGAWQRIVKSSCNTSCNLPWRKWYWGVTGRILHFVACNKPRGIGDSQYIPVWAGRGMKTTEIIWRLLWSIQELYWKKLQEISCQVRSSVDWCIKLSCMNLPC